MGKRKPETDKEKKCKKRPKPAAEPEEESDNGSGADEGGPEGDGGEPGDGGGDPPEVFPLGALVYGWENEYKKCYSGYIVRVRGPDLYNIKFFGYQVNYKRMYRSADITSTVRDMAIRKGYPENDVFQHLSPAGRKSFDKYLRDTRRAELLADEAEARELVQNDGIVQVVEQPVEVEFGGLGEIANEEEEAEEEEDEGEEGEADAGPPPCQLPQEQREANIMKRHAYLSGYRAFHYLASRKAARRLCGADDANPLNLIPFLSGLEDDAVLLGARNTRIRMRELKWKYPTLGEYRSGMDALAEDLGDPCRTKDYYCILHPKIAEPGAAAVPFSKGGLTKHYVAQHQLKTKMMKCPSNGCPVFKSLPWVMREHVMLQHKALWVRNNQNERSVGAKNNLTAVMRRAIWVEFNAGANEEDEGDF